MRNWALKTLENITSIEPHFHGDMAEFSLYMPTFLDRSIHQPAAMLRKLHSNWAKSTCEWWYLISISYIRETACILCNNDGLECIHFLHFFAPHNALTRSFRHMPCSHTLAMPHFFFHQPSQMFKPNSHTQAMPMAQAPPILPTRSSRLSSLFCPIHICTFKSNSQVQFKWVLSARQKNC